MLKNATGNRKFHEAFPLKIQTSTTKYMSSYVEKRVTPMEKTRTISAPASALLLVLVAVAGGVAVYIYTDHTSELVGGGKLQKSSQA